MSSRRAVTAEVRRPSGRRAAFSYAEVCLAVLILSICIVPATRVLPVILGSQQALATKYYLSLIAQERLEVTCAEMQRNFVSRNEAGTLASDGHPTWRYDLLVETFGGSKGRYATLRVRAWEDRDADGVLDAGEPQVRYDTILANSLWAP